MKGTRHSEEQIIAILKQGEAGVATAELCRQHGARSNARHSQCRIPSEQPAANLSAPNLHVSLRECPGWQVAMPEGFAYRPNFLTVDEEAALLSRFRELPFAVFDFHGYVAKRRIVEYGWEYDFGSRQASATQPIPLFLFPFRDRAAKFAGLAPDTIVEAVVTEYPPGAPIGWHRDVPQFETILGISLGSACRMRLKPYKAERKLVSIVLEPRSLYVISGPGRWNYQHSIPAGTTLRYSITFRTLRDKKRQSAVSKLAPDLHGSADLICAIRDNRCLECLVAKSRPRRLTAHRATAPQSGMFPCFFGGFLSRLVSSISRA